VSEKSAKRLIRREPAIEVTEVPNDHLGATAYLAVMCYPGVDARSHQKRNLLVQAIFEYIRGIVKYRAGSKRLTRKKTAAAKFPLLSQLPTMRNRDVYAVCNRAETIFRARRLTSAAVLQKLRLVETARDLRESRSGIQISVGGELKISGIVEEVAARHRIDVRRMWRYWKESQPALHLIDAFFLTLPEPKPGDRSQILIRAVSCYQEWLTQSASSAENRVGMEMLGPHFQAATRVSLVIK